MRAEHATGFVHKIAGCKGFAGKPLQKRGVIAVGNKANILAVPFFCIGESVFFGEFAHLGFCKFAEREHCMPKLFGGKRIKHIALVFAFVDRFLQNTAVALFSNARIVTGRDIIAVFGPCRLKQPPEFNITVAVDAWVRRQARFIGFRKPLHDFVAERFGKIQHLVRAAKPRANRFRIGNIGFRAAGARFAGRWVIIVNQPHRRAERRKPLL